MGPGDTNVPPPALPYESSITHRGMIAADGQAAQLPDCGAQGASGRSAATACRSRRKRRLPLLRRRRPAGSAAARERALAVVSRGLRPRHARGGAADVRRKSAGAFQISGGYVAYDAGNLLRGRPHRGRRTRDRHEARLRAHAGR